MICLDGTAGERRQKLAEFVGQRVGHGRRLYPEHHCQQIAENVSAKT